MPAEGGEQYVLGKVKRPGWRNVFTVLLCVIDQKINVGNNH